MESPTYQVELTWEELVEFEVNMRFGGNATVGEIVKLMHELGWTPPQTKPSAEQS